MFHTIGSVIDKKSQEVLDKVNPKKKLRELKPYQEKAIEIKNYLTDGKDKQSSIFGACKRDIHRAIRAFELCKEVNKPFVNYFFKMYHIYDSRNQTQTHNGNARGFQTNNR